jgi:uncharacterized protein YcnI
MIKQTIALTAVAALALPAAAGAHITAFPQEAPADGYAKLDFRVPHGCDDSPTQRLIVQLPEQVSSVTPQVVPGWEIEDAEEGAREIAWSGGSLPSDNLQEFGMSVKMEGAPGETAWFKAIQECAEGEEAWVEVPVEGQPEPEGPAVGVELVADEGGDGAQQGGPDDAIETQPAAAVGAQDADGASTGLVVASLVVGGLGLGAGASSLVLIRRTRG